MSEKGKGKLPQVVTKCDELMLQPMHIWHFSSPAVTFGGEKTVIVIEEDSSNMNQSWIESLQSALAECIDNYLYEENKIRDEVCEHGVPEVRGEAKKPTKKSAKGHQHGEVGSQGVQKTRDD